MKSYLDEKLHFLEDLRDIPIVQKYPEGIPPVTKEFSEKKLSLLSSVANILYEINGNFLKMYEIYTYHVEKMFGENSFEVSNCYFMIGTCFMEKK